MKRSFIAAVVGLLIAPLLAIVLPGTASAHGWITSPSSRQDQCKRGVVQCGGIKYEPQSVEGPKGLRNCHGNVGRFSELNNDNLGWQVQDVSSNQAFTWRITASHATSTWEYFIGGTRVWSKSDGGARPASTFTHNVNLGSFKGRQKMLVVWNIADTANAFYVCIDVNIR
ncbi:chitin-binding protein [Actinosynnema sp. ALI-1.44]|uniref:lytic polysaccharide monooxygenase auxiliary activity family 9 protein n=1 Tax=Actinosynnema sp. ALI-1.44 TaxID=1933779 RepID=UPI00097BAB83|nr:lytic polysaccharide monooxygenase auxiliary activity family 9 protein [Actinosynnema sp. ALI-1.44]ONI81236.1 chitin-binding protein [Actinosynnema sp. ALI-1.44]